MASQYLRILQRFNSCCRMASRAPGVMGRGCWVTVRREGDAEEVIPRVRVFAAAATPDRRSEIARRWVMPVLC